MKHAWKPHPDSNTIRRPFQTIRFCENCRIEQTWEAEHAWGRIVRRFWYPRAGRCGVPRNQIRGKLGTQPTANYVIVEGLDEQPEVGDCIWVRSEEDLRAAKPIEVLVDEIKFGDYFYLSFV